MKMIICRECGAKIDADLGECPICGMVYYTENGQVKPAEDKEGETRVFDAVPPEAAPEAAPASEPAPSAPRETPPPQPRKTVPPTPAPVPPRRPKRRGIDRRAKWFIVIGAVLLAALTLVLCALSGAFDFKKNGEVFFMTDVTGMTEANARREIEDLNCVASVSYEPSDIVEAGKVIRQLVKESKKLADGETVGIVVSSGPAKSDPGAEAVSVPSVLGSTYENAKQTLAGVGLSILKVADEYSDRPVGEILGQEPSAGSSVAKGEYIRVTVSMGVEPDPEHTITVTAGKGGSVSPKGRVTIVDGEDAVFSITPDEGYEILEVKIDGADVGAVEEYTFKAVDGDHSLYAVFRALPEESPSPSPSAEPSPTPTTTPATPSDIAG